MIVFPKDDAQYKWTAHIKDKMLQYRISGQMIRNVLKSPSRREEGIAPGTFAAMKRNDGRKKKEELWVMYRALPQKKAEEKTSRGSIFAASGPRLLMISVWRYPGITRPGAPIPIPDDVLVELEKIL